MFSETETASENLLRSYVDLLDEIQAIIQDSLYLNTRSLILYGSYLLVRKGSKANIFIPGESDLDLLLILDAGNEDSAEFLKRTTEIFNPIIFEPSYASILDLTLLEVADFPIPIGASLNALNLEAARRGALLFGKNNVLEEFPYTNEQIRLAAMTQAYNDWETMKTHFFHRDMIRGSEFFWMAVDSVLSSAHAFLAFNGRRDLVRLQVANDIEQFLGDPYANTVKRAHELRFGSEIDNKTPFKFVLEAMILLRHLYHRMKEIRT